MSLEVPKFQSTHSPSFRFARRVASRSKRALSFVEELPAVVAEKNGLLSVDLSRTSVDIVDMEEGSYIRQETGLSFGKFVYTAVSLRKKHRSLDDFTSACLGDVEAYELSDTIGMIGAKVLEDEPFFHDRELVIKGLGELSCSVPELDEPTDFYVCLAAFNPALTVGVSEACEYANRRIPGRLDLFDVQAFD